MQAKFNIQTESIMIQSLCVPCCNHCRYCLLSWNGEVEGADWHRSVQLAERFLRELKEQRPNVNSFFTFGYAMEHPDLKGALRTLRWLGSPEASFLQCDGMKMRNGAECRDLMRMLQDEGVQKLNCTVYGLRDYHDRFAGRHGDYDLILRMMKAAGEAGIPFDAGIPITKENIHQVDELFGALRRQGAKQIRLFIPHEEGRGKNLATARLCRSDLSILSAQTRDLLNRTIYRTEAEWLEHPTEAEWLEHPTEAERLEHPEEAERLEHSKEAEWLEHLKEAERPEYPKEAEMPGHPIEAERSAYLKEDNREKRRMILISLRTDNIADYENRSALSVLDEIEALDEAYYASYPGFQELADWYGDPKGEKLYSYRDLFAWYRKRYADEYGVSVYDVTDETRSGSRRY